MDADILDEDINKILNDKEEPPLKAEKNTEKKEDLPEIKEDDEEDEERDNHDKNTIQIHDQIAPNGFSKGMPN